MCGAGPDGRLSHMTKGVDLLEFIMSRKRSCPEPFSGLGPFNKRRAFAVATTVVAKDEVSNDNR